MDVSNRRIVILGKTGAGKSSLANTIFGEKLFKIGYSLNSETNECQAETKSVNGRSITLIDTPGFFDTNRFQEELNRETVRCITECAPGPHAFLIVLKVERYTEHEQAVINKIHEYFSEEALKYTTVVFTHGDQLPEGLKIEDFVRKIQLASELVNKCGGRCHVVDNKYWNNNQHEYRNNQFQVQELLNTIDKIIEANDGSCYTNEMLQTVKREIQQEEEHIRQSSGKHETMKQRIMKQEVRERAKGRVSKKLLIKLAGMATCALLGSFFGEAVFAGVVAAMAEEAGRALSTRTVLHSATGLVAAAGGVKRGFTGNDATEGAGRPKRARSSFQKYRPISHKST